MPAIIHTDLEPELERLAQSMANALSRSDFDAWSAAFSSDAVTWHSTDGKEMTVQANKDVISASRYKAFRYEEVRRYRIEGGFVQQHALVYTARTGAVFRTDVCLVVQVSDGRVTRLEEYIDRDFVRFAQEQALSG